MMNKENYEQNFKNRIKNLNKAQKEAVDAIYGPVMVVAGPGTGKTEILSLRILNILKETDTKPESILALTFTDSGAKNMVERIERLVGSEVAYKIPIFTFHSFCSFIKDKHEDYFTRFLDSKLVDTNKEVEIIENILNNNFFKYLRSSRGQDNFSFLRDIISSIGELKRENINPQDFKIKLEVQKDNFYKLEDLLNTKGKYKGEMKGEYKKLEKEIEKNFELALIYQKYEEILNKDNLYDFNDLILEFIKALESDKDLKQILQEEYQFILADEHQDVNDSQNKIIELLTDYDDTPNIFVVGDDKQAIFRFQGANLANFLYFKNKYKKSKIIFLDENYRSNQTILDAAIDLINKNETENKLENKKLKSNHSIGKSHIDLNIYNTREEELLGTALEIKKLIELGTNPEEIAVLVRTNKEVLEMGEYLSSLEVSCSLSLDVDILENRYIKNIVSILECLRNFGNDAYLAKIIFLDFLNIDSLAAYRLIQERYKEKKSLFESLKENRETKEVYTKLENWHKIYKNEGFLDIVSNIIKDQDFLKNILKSKDSTDNLGALSKLLNYIKNNLENNKNFSLDDFISKINNLAKYGIPLNIASKSGSGVRVQTIFKSKGLEYDYVFVPKMIDKNWGNRRNQSKIKIILDLGNNDKDNDEDERRLLFVAITRARKGVTLSYSKIINEKDSLKSKFIDEINSNLIHINNITLDKNQTEEFFVDTLKKEAKENKIFSKDFIFETFIERGLNATSLNSFLDCKYKFFWNNLIQIPKLEEKPQIMGTCIHSALEHAFLNKDKTIDRKILLENSLNKFEENIKNKIYKEIDLKESIEEGKEAIINWFKHQVFDIDTISKTEYSIKGIDFISKNLKDPLKIKGNLDRVDMLGDFVNVYDYKTGKVRSREELMGENKSGDRDYFRQLLFYKLLVESGGITDKRVGEACIEFVTTNKKGGYKKETFNMREESLDGLKEEVEEMILGIKNFEINNFFCDEKDCEYCNFTRNILDIK